MLVLARKKGQSIFIGKDIKIVVVEVTGETVRLGIEAPARMEIYRSEVYQQIQEENKVSLASAEGIMDLLKKVSQEKK